MSTWLSDLPTLTIALGATPSNIIQGFEDADCVYVWSRTNSAYTGTITVSVVANTSTATDSAIRADLTSAGSDVTLAAGNVVPITDTAFRGLMVYSSATESAVRTFTVTKRVRVGH